MSLAEASGPGAVRNQEGFGGDNRSMRRRGLDSVDSAGRNVRIRAKDAGLLQSFDVLFAM
jgi:hypothetical protein